jgi:phosphatidylserine synthase
MGAVIALMIYLVCGALRLARYDPRIQKDAFRGMPIPMAGLVLTGMSITAGGMPLFLLVPMTLGLLMVCDIPFMKLKFTGSKRLLPAFCVFSFAVLYLLTRDVAVATLGFAVPYALANLGLSLVNEARAATR